MQSYADRVRPLRLSPPRRVIARLTQGFAIPVMVLSISAGPAGALDQESCFYEGPIAAPSTDEAANVRAAFLSRNGGPWTQIQLDGWNRVFSANRSEPAPAVESHAENDEPPPPGNPPTLSISPSHPEKISEALETWRREMDEFVKTKEYPVWKAWNEARVARKAAKERAREPLEAAALTFVESNRDLMGIAGERWSEFSKSVIERSGEIEFRWTRRLHPARGAPTVVALPSDLWLAVRVATASREIRGLDSNIMNQPPEQLCLRPRIAPEDPRIADAVIGAPLIDLGRADFEPVPIRCGGRVTREDVSPDVQLAIGGAGRLVYRVKAKGWDLVVDAGTAEMLDRASESSFSVCERPYSFGRDLMGQWVFSAAPVSAVAFPLCMAAGGATTPDITVVHEWCHVTLVQIVLRMIVLAVPLALVSLVVTAFVVIRRSTK